MESGRTKATFEKILRINKKFHGKKLLNKSFYEQLLNNEINYQKSVIIDFFPDGYNTYVFLIIDQENNILKLDIDLDSEIFSEFENVSKKYYEKYNQEKIHKSWTNLVVAINNRHLLANIEQYIAIENSEYRGKSIILYFLG